MFRAKSAVGAPPLDPSRVASLQLMLSKFEYDGALNPTHTPGTFDFELRVSKIVALAESSPSSSSSALALASDFLSSLRINDLLLACIGGCGVLRACLRLWLALFGSHYARDSHLALAK